MEGFRNSLEVYSWFVSCPLRSGLGPWELVPGLALLAMVLGHAFFTDLHGKIISDRITLPLFVSGVAIAPLLAPVPWKWLAFGAGASFVFFAMIYTGRFGAGDAKLLAGLSFLFYKAVIGIFFLAGFIAFFYAIPVMVLAARARRRGEEIGKLRKLRLQLGPAIAIACAVPIAVSANPYWGLGFLGLMLLTVAGFELGSRFARSKVHESTAGDTIRSEPTNHS